MKTSGIMITVGKDQIEDIKTWRCHCGHKGMTLIFKDKPKQGTKCPNCRCLIKTYG